MQSSAALREASTHETVKQGSVYNIAGNARVHLGNNFDSSQREVEIRQFFLAHLISERVFGRAQQISSAVPKTYQWMLRPLQHTTLTWDCFANWFNDVSSQQQLYWIHGKPDSGKSTLMNYICENEQTRELLRQWSGRKKLLTPTFFFWNAGSDQQKSVDGMLRSLLYQILEEVHELSICFKVSFML